MDTIIKNSLEKSMSYEDYRVLVSELANTDSTTGEQQTEALIGYTKLNDKRMKRWDKTTKVLEAHQSQIKNSNRALTWLVITESWCGDAAHIMPVLNKVAALNSAINYKVVLRDENPELIDAFLTNGGRAIPKLIMIDDTTGRVVDTFGPRPSEATNAVNKYKAEHGGLTPEFKEDLQRWYNKNKGQNIIEDVTTKLNDLNLVTKS